MNRRHKEVGDPLAKKLETASGALTASDKGFRSKSVQEHHKDADASARKRKSLRGIHRTIQYWF